MGGVMRKIALLIAIVTSLSKLHALYLGNVASPEIIEEGMFLSKDNWMSIKAGYQGDFVFDRKMRAHRGARGSIDQFKTIANQGVFTLNFADRVELYANAGTMSFYISQRPRPDFKRRQYQSDDHFTWGYGGRGIILHWKNTVFGLDGAMQYSKAVPFKWESVNGKTTDVHYHKTKLKYNEWDIAASIAQRIEILTPYFAVEYARVRSSIKHIPKQLQSSGVSQGFKMNNRVYVGIGMGCTISMGSYFDLNVEARLIDQLSCSVAANAKF